MVNGAAQPARDGSRHYRRAGLWFADRAVDCPPSARAARLLRVDALGRAAERLAASHPKGIILSGGPASVYEAGAPTLPPSVLASGLPVLGICYGMQLLAHDLGGRVDPAARREYGHADSAGRRAGGRLLAGLPAELPVWMSHGDHVSELPPSFAALARTHPRWPPWATIAAPSYGVQFHPEVQHTPQGRDLLDNFALDICGCRPDWTPANFIEETVAGFRRPGGRRLRDLWTERRRRFGCGSRAAPARHRRPADLHICRSRAAARRAKPSRWSIRSAGTWACGWSLWTPARTSWPIWWA